MKDEMTKSVNHWLLPLTPKLDPAQQTGHVAGALRMQKTLNPKLDPAQQTGHVAGALRMQRLLSLADDVIVVVKAFHRLLLPPALAC